MICGAIDLLFESTDFEAVRTMVGDERSGTAYIDRGSVIYFNTEIRHCEKNGISVFLIGDEHLRASDILARYTDEGERALDSLDGSLALILLDKRRPSISLVRNKNEHIYYLQHKSRLLFSTKKDIVPYAATLIGRLTFTSRN